MMRMHTPHTLEDLPFRCCQCCCCCRLLVEFSSGIHMPRYCNLVKSHSRNKNILFVQAGWAEGPIFSITPPISNTEKNTSSFNQSKHGQQLLGTFDRINTNTFIYHKICCPVEKFLCKMLKISERCEILAHDGCD